MEIGNAFWGGRDTYLFGAGKIGKNLFHFLTTKGWPITAFLDSNRKLHGKTVLKIPVLDPTDFLSNPPKNSLIIISAAPPHCKEMNSLCQKAGLTEGKDYLPCHPMLEAMLAFLHGVSLSDGKVDSGSVLYEKLKILLNEKIPEEVVFQWWKHEHPLIAFAGKCGIKWVSPTYDIGILPELFSLGEYSGHEIKAFFELASKYCNDVHGGDFCDIGANIGTTAITVAQKKNIGHIYAFEPSRDNFSYLKANITLNRLDDKIEAVNAAISSCNGEFTLALSDVNSGDHRVVMPGRRQDSDVELRAKETIRMFSLDSFLLERDHNIKYLWIDTQGYEYYVLAGAEKMLKKRSDIAIMIELWPRGLKGSGSIDLLPAFIVENFTHYIDVNEYLDGKGVLHDSHDVYALINKLGAVHDPINAPDYTNIFLINKNRG